MNLYKVSKRQKRLVASNDGTARPAATPVTLQRPLIGAHSALLTVTCAMLPALAAVFHRDKDQRHSASRCCTSFRAPAHEAIATVSMIA